MQNKVFQGPFLPPFPINASHTNLFSLLLPDTISATLPVSATVPFVLHVPANVPATLPVSAIVPFVLHVPATVPDTLHVPVSVPAIPPHSRHADTKSQAEEISLVFALPGLGS